MDKIKVNLKNCYGIKSLEHEFDFKKKNTIILYAPNGTMKTSFSNTFKDISNGNLPKDRITDEKGNYEIKIDGIDIKKEEILVVESLDEKFGCRNISKLLVNDSLRKEYEKLTEEIEERKEIFLKELKKIAGNKIDKSLEKIFHKTLNVKDLKELKDKNLEKIVIEKLNFEFEELFNEKTEKLFKTKKFIESVDKYIEKYDFLLENSFLFSKGKINHNNIDNVIKSLDENNFFLLKNEIILSNKKKIENIEEFSKILLEEKNKILNDKEILQKFDDIDKLFSKNNEHRKLREILEENKNFILELKDVELFKEKIIQFYFENCTLTLEELINSYNENTDKISEIIKNATGETTIWEEILTLYKKRFIVPFNLKIANKENSLLGIEEPQIEFYHSGKEIDETNLKAILSQGEKRALYLLQVLYEIETLKKDSQKKLIILDDIADSFDYKNKYAIIEYLYDLLSEEKFKIIILTHNFDFYRTVASRLNLNSTTLMVVKNIDGICLVKGQYTKNLFEVWKEKMLINKRIMLASVPFVRNLIEYLNGNNDINYLKLTNLLHYKESETENMRVNDLVNIYQNFINVLSEKKVSLANDNILDILFIEIEEILKDDNDILLENKILLSMGCRIKCEKYMINKIKEKNPSFLLPTGNQTRALSNEYKKYYDKNTIELKLIEQVNMITPENIHINSFMYEPLLDMSCEYLKTLYVELKTLIGE